MIDDLVNRLRYEHVLSKDKIGCVVQRRNPDGPEAANRIEKLETLIEKLRDDNSFLIDSFDKDFLRQDSRIEKLEAALREIVELGFWDGDRAMDIARKALEGGVE